MNLYSILGKLIVRTNSHLRRLNIRYLSFWLILTAHYRNCFSNALICITSTFPIN